MEKKDIRIGEKYFRQSTYTLFNWRTLFDLGFLLHFNENRVEVFYSV